MGAFLIVTGLVAAILVVFVRLFRKRVARTLEQAGHKLPPELVQRSRAASEKPALASGPPRASTTPVPSREHFLLIYDVRPDFIQRRAQFRDEHLALAWKSAGRGELVLAGALEPPTEQAFLLFRGSRAAAIRFAEADPYVRHGLVRQWRVKQWHTVAGEGAAIPVSRPN